MKKLFLLFTLLLTACAAQQPKEKLVKGCLVEAIEFKASVDAEAKLANSKVWSRVLIAQYVQQNQLKGHAWCVYLYPPGKNQLWAYDYDNASLRVSTTRIREYIDEPKKIAEKLITSVYVKDAFYLEDE